MDAEWFQRHGGNLPDAEKDRLDMVLTDEEELIIEDAFGEGMFMYDGVPHISYGQTAAVEKVILSKTAALKEEISALRQAARTNDVMWKEFNDRLDNVRAVLVSVEAVNDGGWQPMVENILTKISTDLRTALGEES